MINAIKVVTLSKGINGMICFKCSPDEAAGSCDDALGALRFLLHLWGVH
jgi:hypothetical protein